MHDVTDSAVRIENHSLPCETENWYFSPSNKIVVDLLANRAIFPISFFFEENYGRNAPIYTTQSWFNFSCNFVTRVTK